MKPCEHLFRFGELSAVPFEIAPFELLHPETVEVEDLQGDVPFRHAVDEGMDGLFIVFRRERGGEPQTERPCGRKRGFAGECRVIAQYTAQVFAADDEVFKRFAGNRDGDLRYGVGTDFVGHVVRAVHEHAVPARGNAEGNGFVALFTAGTAVGVPGLNALPVFRERSELFAEAIDGFADRKVELFTDVRSLPVFRIRPEPLVDLGFEPPCGVAFFFFNVRQRTGRTAGETFVPVEILHVPVFQPDPDTRSSGGHFDVSVCAFDEGRIVRIFVQLKLRSVFGRPSVVNDADPDDILHYGGEGQFQIRSAEGLSAVPDARRSGKNMDRAAVRFNFVRLTGVPEGITALCEPVSVCKFHGLCTSFLSVLSVILSETSITQFPELCKMPQDGSDGKRIRKFKGYLLNLVIPCVIL